MVQFKYLPVSKPKYMDCYWFYTARFYKFIDLLQQNYIYNNVMLSKFKVTVQVVTIWHHIDRKLRNV